MVRLTHHRTCKEPGCSIGYRITSGADNNYCDVHHEKHFPLTPCYWCDGPPFFRMGTLIADGHEFCDLQCLNNYWEYCRTLKEMASGL